MAQNPNQAEAAGRASSGGSGGPNAWQQQPPQILQRPPNAPQPQQHTQQQQQPMPQQQQPQGFAPPPHQQQQPQQQRRSHQPQQQQGHRGGGGPPAIHTHSGVPFGHVPAYLPGSASLVEELDQRLLIVLRDGKHIVGTMISYDQFSNLILQDALERRVVVAGGICHYHDIPLGLYIVRGDSMVLMGQLDSMQESRVMKHVEFEEIERLREQQEGAPGGVPTWDFDSDLIA